MSSNNTKLPYSLEAERACLGSVVLKNNLFEEIFDSRFNEHNFYDRRHILIIEAIKEYRKVSGDAASFDVLTIAEELKKSDNLKKIGGIDYLNEIIDAVPSTVNAKSYAAIIKEKSNLRKVIDISETAIEKAHTNDISKDVIAETLQDYFKLSIDEDKKYEHIQVPLTEAIDIMSKYNKDSPNREILSGYKELDELIIGLRKSNLVILGGRTGKGKTAFALNMMERICLDDEIKNYITDGRILKQKYSAGFFSLEMTKREICYRILANQSEINLKELTTVSFAQDKWSRMIDVVDKIKNSSIYIDDTPGIKMQDLTSKAKKMKKEGNINILFVDYLQLIQVHDSRIPREQQISEISKQLKNLARELDIPVVALTQLNRSADSREDQTPKLSDIRESGAIEQDADIVMFVSDLDDRAARKKKGKNDEELEEEEGIKFKPITTKLISVAKNRHGATGEIKLNYEGQYLRFDDFIADMPY